MTGTPTDEGNNSPEPQETDIIADEEIIDDDPMIAEMKEAEAEIEALNEEKAVLEAKTGEEAPEGNDKGKEAGKTGSGTAKDDGDNSPMIPKPRFDEVLSERDLLRNQVGYMRGLLDASQQNAGNNTPAPKQEATDKTEQKADTGNQEGSEVDEIDAAIEAAEAKKLEYAEKYDEGEISNVELTKAQIEIDKSIRALSKQRLEKVSEDSKAHTNAALSAQQQKDFIDNQALSVQQSHPNIAVIDSLPESTSAVIWNEITNQAARNLAQRGVNLRDNSPQTRVALIQEKAKLTDQLTPENTTKLLMGQYSFVNPSQYQPQQQAQGQTTETGKGQPSAEAKNLKEKLELANSQPPSIADMGQGTDTGELTEDALANMTEDQMADLLQKSPQLVQRVLGKSAT